MTDIRVTEPLGDIDAPAPWMKYARSKIGIKERPGPKQNHPFIVECIKEAGLPKKYWNDETAWCGCFANKCFKETGFRGPPGPAGARHWALPCPQLIQLEEPVHGCILVFNRPPKPKNGHVGFFDATGGASDDDLFYNTLGGNEDNSVKVKPYPKSRFIGAYWPAGWPLPPGAKLFQPEFV